MRKMLFYFEKKNLKKTGLCWDCVEASPNPIRLNGSDAPIWITQQHKYFAVSFQIVPNMIVILYSCILFLIWIQTKLNLVLKQRGNDRDYDNITSNLEQIFFLSV